MEELGVGRIDGWSGMVQSGRALGCARSGLVAGRRREKQIPHCIRDDTGEEEKDAGLKPSPYKGMGHKGGPRPRAYKDKKERGAGRRGVGET